MSGRRRRLALLSAALAAGAALWLWAAHALWTSTAAPPVDVPHLDPSRYFSAPFLHRSATYERFLGIEGLLATATLVVVLVVYARRGQRLARESAAGRVGTGILLAMLGFAVVWLAEVPFQVAALWWQRRYDVSHQGYFKYLVDSFLQLGSEFVFVGLAVAIAMGVAGVTRRWWWLAAAPLFVGLSLLFTFVSPFLIPETSPVESRTLRAEARALERIEGVDEPKLEVQDVHGFTTAPNAETTGLGPTTTVVLWDTLLRDGFNRSEVRFVIGHELGHVAHDDALKGVGWLALFLVPALGLIALATRRRGGMARPEAVPVAILVLVVVQLVATPFVNIVQRRVETAADWAALNATHEPATDRAVMRKLSVRSLNDPDPPGWMYALFWNHPTAIQRIGLANAWETERPSP